MAHREERHTDLGPQSQSHAATKGMQIAGTLRETPPVYGPEQREDKQPD